MIGDPITKFFDKITWIFWILLWVSIVLGVGQDLPMDTAMERTTHWELFTVIITVLAWGATATCIVRQVYYMPPEFSLVKLGNWLILFSTSMLAFRMTYVLLVYGESRIILSSLISMSVLCLGIILSTIGHMVDPKE